jgi:spore germination protein
MLRHNDSLNKTASDSTARLSVQVEHNMSRLEAIFHHCYDLVKLPWHYGPELQYRAVSYYFESLIHDKKHNYMKESLQDLVTHVIGPADKLSPEQIIDFFSNNGVSAQSAKIVADMDEAAQFILNGCLVIFIDGWDFALGYEASRLETRQVTEPVSEAVVQGPRESTVERLEKNIGMLRERMRSPQFKLESFTLNGFTKTEVVYGYLEGVIDASVLEQFKSKLAKYTEGEVLETSYIEEILEESSYSPFPQFRYTERTDTAAAALLSGKLIVLVQGTGSILICPGYFVEMLQSSEDYYQRSVFSTLIRLMRVAAFFIALALPSVYIALTTFHTELIPTVLLLAIVDSREGLPFPAFIEAIIMEFFFELLREAGIRLPRPVGSAVSIVGALVIGEAAINAGIASPIMVVVVALTGIASFAIPQYNMAIALRILRFPLMLFAAVLGGFGVMIACLLILLHLVTLKSLGQPYLNYLAPLQISSLKDVLVRISLKKLMKSPRSRHIQ